VIRGAVVERLGQVVRKDRGVVCRVGVRHPRKQTVLWL
jgi:hypothetical protein